MLFALLSNNKLKKHYWSSFRARKLAVDAIPKPEVVAKRATVQLENSTAKLSQPMSSDMLNRRFFLSDDSQLESKTA